MRSGSMKRIVASAVALFGALLSILSCNTEVEQTVVLPEGQLLTITAISNDETDETKTALEDGGVEVFWQPKDSIKVFRGANGSKFVTDIDAAAKVATFFGTAPVGDGEFVAVYPYAEETVYENSVVTVSLPSVQTAVEGSFAPDTYITMGHSETTEMGFYAVCGGLRFTLSQEGIQKIVFEAAGGESVAGKAKVAFVDGRPAVQSVEDGVAGITVGAPDGQCFQTGKWYYLVAFPTSLSEGYKFTFYKGNTVGSRSFDSQVAFKRGVFGSKQAVDSDVPFEVDVNSITIKTVPQFQYNGNDALKYNYFIWKGLNFNTSSYSTFDDEGAWTVIRSKNAPNASNVAYVSGATSSIDYAFEPEGVDYESFDYLLKGFTSGSPSMWVPSISNVSDQGNGVVRLGYAISDPSQIGDDSKIQLSVNNRQNKTIESDALPIVPLQDQLQALCFTSNYYSGVSTQFPLHDELYLTAADAARAQPSLYVLYDDGPYSLEGLLGVHINQADGLQTEEVRMAWLQERYPGLRLSYELINYELGDAGTPQNRYAFIDSDRFIVPAYVYGGQSLPIPARSDCGISAVGRRPIVLVKLIDTNKKNAVVLAGYFKIGIVTEVVADPFGEPESQPEQPETVIVSETVFKEFKFPYICGTAVQDTKWSDFSEMLELVFRESYGVFRHTFTCDGRTYVKNQSGSMVESTDFGTIEYIPDCSTSGAVNDLFHVSLSKSQADRIGQGKTRTIYVRFECYPKEVIFVGFNVTVGCAPLCTFSQSNPAYWFNDFNASSNEFNGGSNTIRANVPIPFRFVGDGSGGLAPGDDNVTEFDKCFEDCWVGSKIQVTLSGSDATFRASNFDNSKIKYYFSFATAQQPKYTIDGVTRQLTVNAARDQISWNGTPVAYITEIPNESDYTKTRHIITYACNEVASRLLNQCSDNEKLYCKVTLNADYVDGVEGMGLGSVAFNVRFLPPVSFGTKSAVDMRDGIPTGDSIPVGALFSATDWEGYPVCTPLYENVENPSKITGYECCYYPDKTTKYLNWYGYYQFRGIYVDVENVLTNQLDPTKGYDFMKALDTDGKMSPYKLSNVNPSAKWWVSTTADRMTKIIPPEVDIKLYDLATGRIPNLSDYVFNYFNNNGVVYDFSLFVPIVVKYAWGEYHGLVEVPVKSSSMF